MIAILRMGVVVHPAIPEVQQVCQHNKYYRKRQYPQLILMPFLFGKEQCHARKKNYQGQRTMVMPLKAVKEGKSSDT